MNATELQKLMKAGFTVITVRSANNLHTIWQKTPQNHEWHLLEKVAYTSKASLKRRLVELLKDQNIIDLHDSLHSL